MNSVRITGLALAFAASAALAQTAGSPGVTTPAPATPASPSVISPVPSVPSAPAPSTGALASATIPGNSTIGSAPFGSPGDTSIAGSGSSVAAQAQQRRQLALQQCQGVSDASRGACIQAADDDFARATGSDQLARGQPVPALAAGPGSATGAMAGNPRSTPDLSPSVRDNNTRGALTR